MRSLVVLAAFLVPLSVSAEEEHKIIPCLGTIEVTQPDPGSGKLVLVIAGSFDLSSEVDYSSSRLIQGGLILEFKEHFKDVVFQRTTNRELTIKGTSEKGIIIAVPEKGWWVKYRR